MSRLEVGCSYNMMGQKRLRYKIFTSFALSALCLVMIARLWGIAPPSAHTAAAYATATVLAAAAFWRGLIFTRAANAGTKS
jgi:hypothetical protein